MEVIVEEVGYVKPPPHMSNKTHHLYLSSLDLFWREFTYNRRLLFYVSSTSSGGGGGGGGGEDQQLQDCIVRKLKLSLSETLRLFYPLAGRLFSGHDGRLSIDCSDSNVRGVEFVVASVGSPLSHAFPDNDSPPCPNFDNLVKESPVAVIDGHHPNINDLPLLSIQVTKFSCGGFALGFAHSHVVADEHSLWHFMNSWANVTRGDPISYLPIHDRMFFKADKPSAKIASRMNLPLASQDVIVAEPQQQQQQQQKPKTSQLVEKLFHLSHAQLNSLQKCAGVHPNMSRAFNPYELLCAHWWKHVTKARNLEDHKIVRMSVFGDMRWRVSPLLGPAYFGNAVMFALASTTSCDLMNKDLGDIAFMIHNTAKDCDEARVWPMIHWLELNGNIFGERIQWDESSMMHVVSSPKFNVYGVDFGWGKPVAVRPASVTRDGELVLFPGSHGGIDIYMALGQSSMERLLRDPEFLSMYDHCHSPTNLTVVE